MEIYHDQVLEAAYLHTKPGCFFIGPFARRVSFASQQYRALDLVLALDAKGKLVRDDGTNKTIAIVGAGIAGLTAAVALRGQGCTVHLYERYAEPLNVQKHAAHRLIHPTISRWPLEELRLTTDFAFLDWFAAPSDLVIRSMRRDWDEWLAPRENDPDFLFMPGVRVVGLKPNKEIVRLVTKPNPNVVPQHIGLTAYDYVIVTTGFDEEEAPAGLTSVSYWTADEVEAWRADQAKEIFISGCGDGGLIDALRLVHGGFDRGWLTVRLAQILGTTFKKEIRDAEESALMAAKSLACMRLADGPSDDKNAATRKLGARYEDDAIVSRLTEAYAALAQKLPQTAKQLLERSLEAAAVLPGRVTLVSRQVGPFGPYAAPIHKLMVAHALETGRIGYEQGELQPEGAHGTLRFLRTKDTRALNASDGLIIRHGSPANLGDLLSDAERESLRIRQFMLADYIDTDPRREAVAPVGYPQRTTPGYVSARYAMVKDLVSFLLPGARVSATAEGYSYELASLKKRDDTAVEVPKKVFGLDLIEAAPAQAEWL